MTPQELAEAYREYARKMDLYMDGPTTTHFDMLVAAGIELPKPEDLSDSEISAKLWEVIHGLARVKAFLSETNHLNDRELYSLLWHERLRVDEPVFNEVGFTTHIGLLSGGGEPETSMYLRFYASEESRRHWLDSFPDYDMPPHEDPPFDRDRSLPVAYEGRGEQE